MPHTDATLLIERLRTAADRIQVGGRYAHYKQPEKAYRITSLAITEADESVAVVYAQEETGLVFVRPLSEFLEELEYDGRKVARFVKIEDKK